MVNPPTPWIGSAIRQATSRAVPAVSRCLRSATHASVYSTLDMRANAGRYLSVPCRYCTLNGASCELFHATLPVIATAPNERPW